MDAIELCDKTGKPVGFWICGKCKKVTLSPMWYVDSRNPKNTQEAAEACCRPPKCVDCGDEFEASSHRRNDRCKDCELLHDRLESETRLSRRLEKAVEVPDDGSMVCCEEIGYRDGWFQSLDDLIDHLTDDWVDDETGDPMPWPEFCFASKADVRQFSAVHAFDRELERMHEDGFEDMEISPSPELIAAAEKFNAQNQQAFTVYNVDYSRKIRIPAPQPV